MMCWNALGPVALDHRPGRRAPTGVHVSEGIAAMAGLATARVRGTGWAGQDRLRDAAHFRRFDPTSECRTTLSGTPSPSRRVNTALRLHPRSSSTIGKAHV